MAGTHVVYLVWPPMGPEPLERFAASYRTHPAGLEHRLTLVTHGPADQPLRRRCQAVAGDLDAHELAIPASGRDLDAYRVIARELPAQELLLLNSYSQVLATGWLAMLHAALARPGVGLVGCTGSYESALSAAPRPLRPWLRRRYPPFPNPHLRTNAVMMLRERMLALDWPPGGSKRRALELESGRRGITRQVWAAGLRALVVDRHGEAHEPADWPRSLTFRSGRQENLLIADNRTRQYDEADAHRRAELAGYAWGDRAPVSPPRPAPTPTG